MTADYMKRHHLRPEYTATAVNAETGRDEVQLELAAWGGGTVGESYPHNQWVYRVWRGTSLVASGDQLRSGSASTHREMAEVLADFFFSVDGGVLL